MEISGVILAGEGARACGPLRRRLMGWKSNVAWVSTPLAVILCFAGVEICRRIAPGLEALGVILGALLAWIVATRLARRLMAGAWRARGLTDTQDATYRVEDDALVFDTPGVQTRLAWTRISEIAPGAKAWLFIGVGQAYFLPTRFFTDPGGEAAFLAACVERLTPEARARSGEAVALAARKAGPWGVTRP
jgi:hypothetical protein